MPQSSLQSSSIMILAAVCSIIFFSWLFSSLLLFFPVYWSSYPMLLTGGLTVLSWTWNPLLIFSPKLNILIDILLCFSWVCPGTQWITNIKFNNHFLTWSICLIDLFNVNFTYTFKYAVAQLVEALYHKQEGCGFDLWGGYLDLPLM
jgi:hypothetical protein